MSRPYRDPTAAPDPDAPARVHECGDIVVHLRAPVGPATIRLDPKTAQVRYEPRLHELSTPLFLTAFLFAACEAGTLGLLARTTEKLPDRTLLALSIPLLASFVAAAFGLVDPAARRVRVRGASRSGQRIATELTFPTTQGARSFATKAQHTARIAKAVAGVGEGPSAAIDDEHARSCRRRGRLEAQLASSTRVRGPRRSGGRA